MNSQDINRVVRKEKEPFKDTKAQRFVINYLINNKPEKSCEMCGYDEFPHARYEIGYGLHLWFQCPMGYRQPVLHMNELRDILKRQHITLDELAQCGFVVLD